MKKLIPTLLLLVISLFAIPGANANSLPAKNAVTAKSTTAVTSGHWEYWCIYNEETGEFEIVAVWVEDEGM